jgi:hypothetical protein|tara:strand:- start:44 stop:292 length:249 start_codon:yes stop_codon:yes gene_type:complete
MTIKNYRGSKISTASEQALCKWRTDNPSDSSENWTEYSSIDELIERYADVFDYLDEEDILEELESLSTVIVVNGDTYLVNDL